MLDFYSNMSAYARVLKEADIFYQFTTAQLELVASLCREQIYQTGECIFLEGSRGEELYVILSGEVDILVDPALVSQNPNQDHQPATIATLRRGQSFGEISLVDQGIRSATARAAQNDTRLLALPSQQIRQLCETDHYFGYLLMRNLAADLALKIRSTDMRIREELLEAGKSK